MKKLVGKTIGITLAVVFGFFAVFSGIVVLFCPKVYGRIFLNMGHYKSSIWCFERQYNVSKSIDDLAVLVLNCKEEDVSRLEKYSFLMITHEDYSEYIQTKWKKNFLTELKAEEYFYSKCAVVKFDSTKASESLTMCGDFVSRLGYTQYSPLRTLIAKRQANFSEQDKTAIKNFINSVKGGLSGEQLEFAESDILSVS